MFGIFHLDLGWDSKILGQDKGFCTVHSSFHIQTNKYFSWQQMMVKLCFWNLMFKLKQSRKFCRTHFIHSLTLHIMHSVHQKDLKFLFRIFSSFCSIQKYCYLNHRNNCTFVYFKCHFCTTKIIWYKGKVIKLVILLQKSLHSKILLT